MCLLGTHWYNQFLALYTDRESHNAQRYGHTDIDIRQTDRQTNDRMLPTADHTV